MSKSSLSNVVSSLVRASMGSSVNNTVTDEELDRHVAELILKEAKQKAERYLQDGVAAYLPDTDSERVPRANKRFLSAIIRNTDDHNKTILKAQADAALELKAQREEEEKRERKARAKEAADAERTRRSMGSSSRRHTDVSREHRQDSERRHGSRSRRGGGRDREEEDRRRRSHRHSRSRSPAREDGGSDRHRKRRRRHSDEKEEDGRRRKRSWSRSDDERHDSSKRKREHSGSRRHDRREASDKPMDGQRDRSSEEDRNRRKHHSRSASRERTPRVTRNGTEARLSRAESFAEFEEGSSTGKTRHPSSPPSKPPPSSAAPDLTEQLRARAAAEERASPTLSEEEDIERFRPKRKAHRRPLSPAAGGTLRPPRAGSGSASPGAISSKMDKYFEPSYDPLLDTGPLTIPQIPSTGLLNSAEFEGWEAMLELVRQKREDKAEKKRLERRGLLPTADKDKAKTKDSKKGEKEKDTWATDAGVGAMDIQYSKRGTVREWDMGKDNSF